MENDQYQENNNINSDISIYELLVVIGKLKNNKSCGINGIPNEVLKHDGITPMLLGFMNMCFTHNIIPTLWTKSFIKPIPKNQASDQCAPLNYRCIRPP